MTHKLTVALSIILPAAIFIRSFFWFSRWEYGVLGFCLIAILTAIIWIKHESFLTNKSNYSAGSPKAAE